MKYYHGGVGGLRVGDLLTPPDERGKSGHTAALLRRECNQKNTELADLRNEHRTDRVYLTNNEFKAYYYAAVRGGGVYRVEPIGDVAADPENPNSFMCERAKIVEVIRVPFKTMQRIRNNPDIKATRERARAH
jgi:hypothetical protein